MALEIQEDASHAVPSVPIGRWSKRGRSVVAALATMPATLGSGLSSERRITSRNNNLVNVYIVLFFCYRFMTLFAFEIQANTP